MGDNVDDLLQQLQDQILQKTKEVYGEIAFERWLNPLYTGSLKEPDGHGRLRGVCGDTMEIFLKFENDRVKKASFQTDGCGPSVICGSFAAEMSLGKSPDELLEITGEAIMEILGGLPKEEAHCAFLAAQTVQEALNEYMIRQARSFPK